MSGLRYALKSELYLALRSRGVRAAIILPAALAFGRIALGKLNAIARQVEAAARGGAGAKAIEANAYGPFVDGLAAGLMLGALLLLILSSTSIAMDRDLGVVRLPLTRRVGRPALVLSKFIVLCFLAALMTGAVLGAAWAGGATFYEFGPVAEDGYQIFSAAEVRREIWKGLLAAAITLPGTAAFGLLISAFARTATESVAVALPAVLAFDVLKGLFGKAAHYLFFTFQPTLIDRSYLSEVSKLARGFSDAGFPENVVILNFAVPAPEALVLLAAALAIVLRRKM